MGSLLSCCCLFGEIKLYRREGVQQTHVIRYLTICLSISYIIKRVNVWRRHKTIKRVWWRRRLRLVDTAIENGAWQCHHLSSSGATVPQLTAPYLVTHHEDGTPLISQSAGVSAGRCHVVRLGSSVAQSCAAADWSRTIWQQPVWRHRLAVVQRIVYCLRV